MGQNQATTVVKGASKCFIVTVASRNRGIHIFVYSQNKH